MIPSRTSDGPRQDSMGGKGGRLTTCDMLTTHVIRMPKPITDFCNAEVSVGPELGFLRSSHATSFLGPFFDSKTCRAETKHDCRFRRGSPKNAFSFRLCFWGRLNFNFRYFSAMLLN